MKKFVVCFTASLPCDTGLVAPRMREAFAEMFAADPDGEFHQFGASNGIEIEWTSKLTREKRA